MSDSNLIILILGGIIVITMLWVLLRDRGGKPALPDEKPVGTVEAPATPPAAVAEPVPQAEKPARRKAPAKKPAEKQAAKPRASAPRASVPKAARPPKAAPSLLEIGVPAAVGDADNLLLLKGVGPKLNTLLQSLGISRFDQIGAWTAEDAARVDAHLGTFKGRIERDGWIEQAGLLARGEIAAFETRFGKLDSEN